MKITFLTQRQLCRDIGIPLPRIWKVCKVSGILSNAAADPRFRYNNIILLRCPLFVVAIQYGK